MRVKLKNVGAAWKGQDFDGTELTANPGDVVEMSEERAKMLVADYPGRFDVVGGTRASAPASPPAEPPKPRRKKGRR